MATASKNTFEQVYNVREESDLSSKVSYVICAILQRGIMVAGFSATKELLIIHYTGYNSNKPIWEIDFFEYLISQEALFTNKEKVKAVFICSEKNFVVPDDLYEEKAAKDWLKRIHFVESRDVTDAFHLEDDKARYVHAVSQGILELIKINFRKATVQPMSLYQFRNTKKMSLQLHGFITNEQVSLTLHNYSQLLWHKIFDYSCAEDIAYGIKHFCMENNISPSKIAFKCDAVSAAEFDTLNALSQYFPGLRSGKGVIETKWDATISLALQLFECV